jgi:eukaryotic-like serine/threonine-protein kinase
MATTVRDLFLQASEIALGDERDRFLDQACGGDQGLRRKVEALLSADERPLGFIQRLDGPPADWPDRTEDVPHVSDRYTLIRKVGEGGMGTVWVAEQHEPVRRTVAVKLIKPGMDSEAVLRRFEAERQALAIMDHPGIAKVLDAGTTSTGRPYFVMELVDGQPITEYCDSRRLNTEQRIRIFAEVCESVQHAHQKGVIHRDIKPSNVLVGEHDGRPRAKVIDFGVAKAVGSGLVASTAFTQPGQFVGTLEYMSPEQAGTQQVDVDTRSDIYSLGVLLYELLAGTTPFEGQQLRDRALEEMLRIIREDEPPRPSAKLSTSESLPSLAANRAMDPSRLTRTIRGDLDWVVMKALEKHRERRYASANAMADDLRRYLANEPVLAGPPSAVYRIRKFLRRNRAAVAAASLVIVALAAGMAAAFWGWTAANRAAHEAQLARATALSRLKQIETGNKVLTSIFDELNPDSTEEKPLRAVLAERLGDAAGELMKGDISDPVAAAKVQHSLATSLLNLGFAERALDVIQHIEETYQTHLGAEAQETLSVQHSRAACYVAMGQFDKALALNKQVLATKQRVLGPTHDDTLNTMSNLASLYADMGKLQESAVETEAVLQLYRQRYGSNHHDTLAAEANLAQTWLSLGDTDRALKLMVETLDRRKALFPPGDIQIADGMNMLACAYAAAGKHEQAAPLVEEAWKAFRQDLGPDHPKTLTSAQNLCIFLMQLGRAEQALPILNEILEQRQVKLGRDHPDTLASLNYLASAYYRLGKYDQALPLYQDAYEKRQRALGAEHPATLGSRNDLAATHVALCEFDRAVPMLKEILKAHQAVRGPGHQHTLSTMSLLAKAYRDSGNQQMALSLYADALEQSKASLGVEHAFTLLVMTSLAKTMAVSEQFAEGIPLAEHALKLATERFSDLPANLEELPIVLASFYSMAGRQNDAEKTLRRSLDKDRESFGRTALRTIKIMTALGKLLFDRKQYDEAESLVSECLANRQDKEPETWSTYYTQSLLGAIRLRQGKRDQAEPLLKEGFSGMQQCARRAPVPERESRLTEVEGWIDELKPPPSTSIP